MTAIRKVGKIPGKPDHIDGPMYGITAEKDESVINAHLARLRQGAVVINLGCGPNVQHELDNLARMVGRFQFQSTLILADLYPPADPGKIWVPGPEKVEVRSVNAATATTVLGKGRADLILALGLFGALDSTTTEEGTGKFAWPAVLRECLELLKPLGELIVSNSCERQPFVQFKEAVEGAGFTVTQHHVSTTVWAGEKPGDQRYLIVCQKLPKPKINEIPSPVNQG